MKNNDTRYNVAKIELKVGREMKLFDFGAIMYHGVPVEFFIERIMR